MLAFEAVCGLARAALWAPFLAPFSTLAALAVPALAVPALAAPALAAPALAAPALAAPALAAPALAGLGLAVLALAGLGLAGAPSFRAEVRALLAVARADLAADLADAAVRGLAAPARFALDGAGSAGAAGLATDSVFAAVVSALAAVVMAFVAVFMDCIAVDIVLADEVALVAAAVILVAAEVTLVAADETVLAAIAGVGRELVRPPVALVPRVLFAVPAAERAVVLRVDRAAVPLMDDLAPVARAVALELGRPAERLAALVLTDRVLSELAGLRRAVARVVVCTGTDFPPS